MVLVSQCGDRWEFRPSRAQVRTHALMSAVLIVGCLLFAGLLFGSPPPDARGWLGPLCGSLCLLSAAAMLAAAVSAWWLRRTPLTVERSGRMAYGAKEVCAAGTVRAVLLCAHYGEVGDPPSYRVRLRQMDGEVVELPDPYFTEFIDDLGKARSLAGQYAQAFGVEVLDW